MFPSPFFILVCIYLMTLTIFLHLAFTIFPRGLSAFSHLTQFSFSFLFPLRHTFMMGLTIHTYMHTFYSLCAFSFLFWAAYILGLFLIFQFSSLFFMMLVPVSAVIPFCFCVPHFGFCLVLAYMHACMHTYVPYILPFFPIKPHSILVAFLRLRQPRSVFVYTQVI